MRKLLSSLLVLILRPSETGPRSGLQYVARTLGTLWTCTQRVDARAEGGSERPPLHQYRVTIQTPNHKLAGGAKFGTVPKQNPTSFCMSCDITPPQCIPIHPNGIPSYRVVPRHAGGFAGRSVSRATKRFSMRDPAHMDSQYIDLEDP